MVEKYRFPNVSMRIIVIVILAFLSVACGSSSAPEIPIGQNGQSDAELITGRAVWIRHCSTCHGSSGQGGRGKKLNDGAIFKLYPEIDGLVNVVAVGKGQAMPAFESKLSTIEIAAVTRYIREILN